MTPPPGARPPAAPEPNARYLPTTWGCLVLLFLLLAAAFAADLLRRAGVWQMIIQ